MNAKRVLIMAGGTGGHIFPGLALASELRERGHDVNWLGTENGMEADLVPKAGIAIHYISVKGIRGKGLTSLFSAPWNILSSVLAALAVIKKVKPHVVVGLGGFVAGPGGVAAKLKGLPLVIHEQNAVAGTTNRLLANIATRVLSAFPCNLRKAQCIGNPVRQEIENIVEPKQRMQAWGEKTNLLVLGGSRGALAINELVPQALALLERHGQVDVRHQAGAGKEEATAALYKKYGVKADVKAFVDDMAEAFSWADIVVCRAGALTVSELAAVGLGSILIPFPYAIDDHQTANAEYLVSGGAALLFQQRDLSVEKLSEVLSKVLFDRDTLLGMALKAKALARPQAAKVFADACEGVMCG